MTTTALAVLVVLFGLAVLIGPPVWKRTRRARGSLAERYPGRHRAGATHVPYEPSTSEQAAADRERARLISEDPDSEARA